MMTIREQETEVSTVCAAAKWRHQTAGAAGATVAFVCFRQSAAVSVSASVIVCVTML